MKFASASDAAAVIGQGGVVAYPTEFCYGLGCDPSNTGAIRRILRLKRRSRDKGLILIADRLDRLSGYMASLPASYRDEILESWPGPFTWLVPARPGVSRWVRGEHDSIAVRVTAHQGAGRLCRAAKMALVSTSANGARQPPLRTAEAVSRAFAGQVDCIVGGRVGSGSSPTTIRDGLTGNVVRP